MKKELKNTTLTIRLSDPEKKLLKEDAEKLGFNVTQYILFKLLYEKK